MTVRPRWHLIDNHPRWRIARGQSAVEFGMVASALMILVIGVISTAEGIYAYNTVGLAASTAIRYASLNGASSSSPATTSSVQSLVYGMAYGLNATSACPATTAGAICASTTWNPNNSAGSTVTVKVVYEFQPLSKFFSTALISISSSETMVIPD
jgi:Flp pilus assembly protein TadG